MNWERRAESYRLQQMRAHQLRKQPPVPAKNHKAAREEAVDGPRRPGSWSARRSSDQRKRQQLYEEALGG